MDFKKCLKLATDFLEFPYDLKDKQIECLQALFEGRDVCAVLCTGYGKSIVFQLYPFLMHAKKHGSCKNCNLISVVITPLNSIMMNQCRSNASTFKSCYLNWTGSSATSFLPIEERYVHLLISVYFMNDTVSFGEKSHNELFFLYDTHMAFIVIQNNIYC